jgi:hypothetical protein
VRTTQRAPDVEVGGLLCRCLNERPEGDVNPTPLKRPPVPPAGTRGIKRIEGAAVPLLQEHGEVTDPRERGPQLANRLVVVREH